MAKVTYMQNLTLIGMPGSGKSAVGIIIARTLGWDFVDTDKFIEKRYDKPLQALIDALGEASFRLIEEETVLQLPISGPTVISTGGSVVYSDLAMRYLAGNSRIVFLDAELSAIRTHIRAEAPRGIVGMTAGGLEELYRQRLPRYRQYADATIHYGADTPEEVAGKVIAQFDFCPHATDTGLPQ